MRIGKKKESLLGVIITAVLCLGFLWWWFRPAPPKFRPAQKWQEQNAVQLVERAMDGTQPEGRVEKQVLDLDMLEIALSQVREQRKDEALAVARHIGDPVILALAARQLAHGWLSSAEDYGEALDFASLVSDPAQQTAVRTDILGMLAMAGFPDAALPEAKTPLQKALLANRILDNDDKVRELLASAQAALPSLPPDEAAAVRREIARGRVLLSRETPPEEAIAAIKTLPLEQRAELWADLAGICQGRPDNEKTVPLVFQQIEDPAIRRRMEIESLIFGVKVRPAAEIIADCQADVTTASSPGAKVAAMLVLTKAQYDSGEEEGKTAASATLKTALQTAQTIPDPALRSRAMLSLARRFSDVVQIDDARAALDQAIAAARAVESPLEHIPLLVETEDESFKQADEPGAVKLMEEAVSLIEKIPGVPAAATVESIASALMRRGQWLRGLTLVDRLTDEPARLATLKAVAGAVAEDCISVNPASPPPRGEPFDTIRRVAIGDQVKAANLAEQQPAGYARTRAWLAMGKAVFSLRLKILSPDSLSGGGLPDGETPGEGDQEPGPPPEKGE